MTAFSNRSLTLARGVWGLLIVLGLVGGLAGLFLFGQDFSHARAWLDRFSPDGSFERLTLEGFEALSGPVRLASIAALVGAAGLWLFRRKSVPALESLVVWCGHELAGLARDGAGLAHALAPSRLDGLALLLLMVGATMARLMFVTRPMAHDEAYTYVAFASRPWMALISDYHLPNNHIFHTILVKLATDWFGNAPWIVRLPALVAGVLCAPATYLLGRRLYNRLVALLSAALVAVLPVAILYSSNARGYSLKMLLTLVIAGLAVYLSEPKHQRNRAAWLLLVLFSAIGFYNLPTMLYPFGMIMAWMFFSALLQPSVSEGGTRARQIFRLVLAGLAVVVITGLLYLPVIAWGTGWKSLVGNPFVKSIKPQFLLETLVSRAQDAWDAWMMDIPDWGGVGVAVGFVLSCVLHPWISRVKVPFQLAAFVWISAIVLVQRPNAMGRVWTFLVPWMAMWVVAGFVGLLERIRLRQRARLALNTALVVVALVGCSAWAWVRTHQEYPGLNPFPGEVEQVVQYLTTRLRDGDIVIIASEDSPVLWYYFRWYGISDRTVHELEKHPFPFHRAFVVVSEREGQTLRSTVEKRGLDPDTFSLDAAVPVWLLGGSRVYEVMAR